MVHDFSPSRAGEHARNFLGTWNGKLVCDDFAGYKAGFEQGITEIGCMAHARHKFFDLHMANKSQLAEQALHSIGGLYEVERQAMNVSGEDRWRFRVSFGRNGYGYRTDRILPKAFPIPAPQCRVARNRSVW